MREWREREAPGLVELHLDVCRELLLSFARGANEERPRSKTEIDVEQAIITVGPRDHLVLADRRDLEHLEVPGAPGLSEKHGDVEPRRNALRRVSLIVGAGTHEHQPHQGHPSLHADHQRTRRARSERPQFPHRPARVRSVPGSRAFRARPCRRALPRSAPNTARERK